MARGIPTPVLTQQRPGVMVFKPGKDGMTHCLGLTAQYGTRKFDVTVKRTLRPVPAGQRRKEADFTVHCYKHHGKAGGYKRYEVPLPAPVAAAALAAFSEALAATPGASPNAKRVTMRQVGGDDGYCWAVMVDGVPKWEGMQRGEASSRRSAEIARLDAGNAGPADVKDRDGLNRLERTLRISRMDVAASEHTITASRKRAERSLRAAR
jgi:hypothetical protein